MLPVAIFRHAPNEGPGYFATFLDAHRIPWQLIAVDAGADIPEHSEDFSGLCLMGGPMSVNDPLPWIEPVCQLIREAQQRQLPVLGHCLGGQLIAKALGGRVERNPVKEIGWGDILCEQRAPARRWLGELAGQAMPAFHWHGETFSLPAGAERLAGNAHCANQMFALGPHLAMQCHVEMTPELISDWCAQWTEETQAADNHVAIQSVATIHAEMADRLPRMRQLADQLYATWLLGLAR